MKRINGSGAEGFVFGYASLEVSEACLLPVLNILLENGIYYREILTENGKAEILISYPSAKKAAQICISRGISVCVRLTGGIPYYFRLIFRRPGAVLGVILAVAILWLGSNVLWDIRVEGNEKMTDEEIKAILAEKGVRAGAFLKGLDVGTVRAEIEAESKEIAWLTLNVIGTVAYVRVVEAKLPAPPAERECDGINLVAARDGVITGLEVISGDICVTPGQTVKKGELLVSGLIDSERFGWRAIESKGSVFAQFETEIAVEIPYEITVRTAEKSEICEISLIFFSFRQKFFKKGGFSGSSCDTINSDIYIYSSKGVTLPVGLSVKSRPIWMETVSVRTRAESVELAYYELNRRLLSDMPNAMILSKSFSGGDTEDGSAYRLICRVECIDDITEEKPFYVNTPE